MSIHAISGGASKILDSMDLAPTGRLKAEECLIKYSAPAPNAPLTEKIKYAAFRIFNFLKAMFGCSEWQMTVKSIVNYDNLKAKCVEKRAIYNVYDSAMKLAMHYHKDKAETIPDKVGELVSYTLGKDVDDKKELVFLKGELKQLPSEFSELIHNIKFVASFYKPSR